MKTNNILHITSLAFMLIACGGNGQNNNISERDTIGTLENDTIAEDTICVGDKVAPWRDCNAAASIEDYSKLQEHLDDNSNTLLQMMWEDGKADILTSEDTAETTALCGHLAEIRLNDGRKVWVKKYDLYIIK